MRVGGNRGMPNSIPRPHPGCHPRARGGCKAVSSSPRPKQLAGQRLRAAATICVQLPARMLRSGALRHVYPGRPVAGDLPFRYFCLRWFPSGIKRERGTSGDARGHGCPRNCERRACPPICDHWETGKVGDQAATREPGDLPSRAADLGRGVTDDVIPSAFQACPRSR
jgi:hypothetical protein